MPNLLSTAQLARKLGVTVSTISRRVQRGELTPVIKGEGIRGAMWFDADESEQQVAS